MKTPDENTLPDDIAQAVQEMMVALKKSFAIINTHTHAPMNVVGLVLMMEDGSETIHTAGLCDNGYQTMFARALVRLSRLSKNNTRATGEDHAIN